MCLETCDEGLLGLPPKRELGHASMEDSGKATERT